MKRNIAIFGISILYCLFFSPLSSADTDNTIGVEDAVYALQISAGINSTIPSKSENITLFNTKKRISYSVDSMSVPKLTTMITVPEGKIFILTDIMITGMGQNSEYLDLVTIYNTTSNTFNSGDITLIIPVNSPLAQVHLNSGIAFPAYHSMQVYPRKQANNQYVSGDMFISGYIIDNE